MNRILWCVLPILLLPVSRGSIKSASPPNAAIALTASVRVDKSGRDILALTLANRSKDELRIDEGDLPWKLRRERIVVVAVEESSGRVLTQSAPLESDSSREHYIRLASGQRLTGEIVLDDVFQGFSATRRAHGMIVMWCYTPDLVGKISRPVFGGILIESSGYGKQNVDQPPPSSTS